MKTIDIDFSYSWGVLTGALGFMVMIYGGVIPFVLFFIIMLGFKLIVVGE